MHGKHITFTPPCVARMLTSGLFMLVTHEWVTCVILPGICENSESNGARSMSLHGLCGQGGVQALLVELLRVVSIAVLVYPHRYTGCWYLTSTQNF